MLPLPFPASTISLDYGATRVPYSKTNPHQGIDFSSRSHGVVEGSRILASAEGVVHRSGWELGSQTPTMDRPNVNAGNSIDVDYPAYGVRVRYMHRPRGSVSPSKGEHVSAGSVLGVIGSTGQVTAAHLHMETWNLKTGRRLSPWLYFDTARVVGDGTPSGGDARPLPIPTPTVPQEDDMLKRRLFQIDPKTDGRWVLASYDTGTYWHVRNGFQLDELKADPDVKELAGPQVPAWIEGLTAV